MLSSKYRCSLIIIYKLNGKNRLILPFTHRVGGKNICQITQKLFLYIDIINEN